MKDVIKIYGGPGCGKTTQLLSILDRLLKTTAPERIAYVSFTNKGTDAGVNRARLKHKLSKKDTPYWDTIHSIANREACKNLGSIISQDNYKEFSIATQMKFLGYFTEELNHGDDIYLFMSQLKRINDNKHSRSINAIPDMNKYEWVIKQYETFKRVMKIYDFTDMLETYIKQNKPLDIDYMMIDEAQDLTPLQWKAIWIMSRNCTDIYVAGDDDQAIYEWCGGDVKIFNNLPAQDETVLSTTHRLCSRVLEASQRIVSNIKERKEKNISTFKKHGLGTVFVHANLDSIVVSHEASYYFLVRNRHYMERIKEFLMRIRMPFILNGIRYPRSITGKNKHNITDLEYQYTKYMKDTGYTRSRSNLITVDTIHRVKGGEADNVILLLDCTKAVQNNLVANIDEELRVLYVAMTRCRWSLHIVYSSTQISYDSIVARSLSAVPTFNGAQEF